MIPASASEKLTRAIDCANGKNRQTKDPEVALTSAIGAFETDMKPLQEHTPQSPSKTKPETAWNALIFIFNLYKENKKPHFFVALLKCCTHWEERGLKTPEEITNHLKAFTHPKVFADHFSKENTEAKADNKSDGAESPAQCLTLFWNAHFVNIQRDCASIPEKEKLKAQLVAVDLHLQSIVNFATNETLFAVIESYAREKDFLKPVLDFLIQLALGDRKFLDAQIFLVEKMISCPQETRTPKTHQFFSDVMMKQPADSTDKKLLGKVRAYLADRYFSTPLDAEEHKEALAFCKKIVGTTPITPSNFTPTAGKQVIFTDPRKRNEGGYILLSNAVFWEGLERRTEENWVVTTQCFLAYLEEHIEQLPIHLDFIKPWVTADQLIKLAKLYYKKNFAGDHHIRIDNVVFTFASQGNEEAQALFLKCADDHSLELTKVGCEKVFEWAGRPLSDGGLEIKAEPSSIAGMAQALIQKKHQAYSADKTKKNENIDAFYAEMFNCARKLDVSLRPSHYDLMLVKRGFISAQEALGEIACTRLEVSPYSRISDDVHKQLVEYATNPKFREIKEHEQAWRNACEYLATAALRNGDPTPYMDHALNTSQRFQKQIAKHPRYHYLLFNRLLNIIKRKRSLSLNCADEIAVITSLYQEQNFLPAFTFVNATKNFQQTFRDHRNYFSGLFNFFRDHHITAREKFTTFITRYDETQDATTAFAAKFFLAKSLQEFPNADLDGAVELLIQIYKTDTTEFRALALAARDELNELVQKYPTYLAAQLALLICGSEGNEKKSLLDACQKLMSADQVGKKEQKAAENSPKIDLFSPLTLKLVREVFLKDKAGASLAAGFFRKALQAGDQQVCLELANYHYYYDESGDAKPAGDHYLQQYFSAQVAAKVEKFGTDIDEKTITQLCEWCEHGGKTELDNIKLPPNGALVTLAAEDRNRILNYLAEIFLRADTLPAIRDSVRTFLMKMFSKIKYDPKKDVLGFDDKAQPEYKKYPIATTKQVFIEMFQDTDVNSKNRLLDETLKPHEQRDPNFLKAFEEFQQTLGTESYSGKAKKELGFFSSDPTILQKAVSLFHEDLVEQLARPKPPHPGALFFRAVVKNNFVLAIQALENHGVNNFHLTFTQFFRAFCIIRQATPKAIFLLSQKPGIKPFEAKATAASAPPAPAAQPQMFRNPAGMDQPTPTAPAAPPPPDASPEGQPHTNSAQPPPGETGGCEETDCDTLKLTIFGS